MCDSVCVSTRAQVTNQYIVYEVQRKIKTVWEEQQRFVKLEAGAELESKPAAGVL